MLDELTDDVLRLVVARVAYGFDDVRRVFVLARAARRMRALAREFAREYDARLQRALFGSRPRYEALCLNPDCYWTSDPDTCDLYSVRHMAHEHQLVHESTHENCMSRPCSARTLSLPFCTQCARHYLNVYIENPTECAVRQEFYEPEIRLAVHDDRLAIRPDAVDAVEELRGATVAQVANWLHLACYFWENHRAGQGAVFVTTMPNYVCHRQEFEWPSILRAAHDAAVRSLE